MSRLSRLVALAAMVLMAASCGRTARIDACVSDLASSDVIIKLLDVNKFEVLDTVALDETGRFSYKLGLEAGQPEFVYLFHGDVKIASLILQKGDKVYVEADTLGQYTVSGSEESSRLADVEKDYAAALSKMTSLASALERASSEEEIRGLRQDLGSEYIAYYRSRIKYVMENSRSLSVIPVFYQNFGETLPVFGQSTDAIHFRNVSDSLSLEYPESKYVKALKAEAEKRMGYLELQGRLLSAEEISFPEIELPDVRAQKHKLSEVKSKVIMLQFWTATDASQKMFNLDVLLPVYEEFHNKGFEIYQVSLDVDKGLWARVVKEQNLPWINVCDSRGTASPYAVAYNLPVLPATFIIADGELVDGQIVDEKSVRKVLDRFLK